MAGRNMRTTITIALSLLLGCGPVELCTNVCAFDAGEHRMPTNYTGNPAGITPGQPVVVTNPADGDAASAASNNSAIQTLTNFVKFLMDWTVSMFSTANTWTAEQKHSRTIDIDTTGIDQSCIVATSPTGNSPAISAFGSFIGVQGETDSASAESSAVRGTSLNAGAAGRFVSWGTGNAVSARRGVDTGSLEETVSIENGHIKLKGDNPDNTFAVTNAVVGPSLVKAWGRIYWSSGNPLLDPGYSFNVSGINVLGNGLVEVVCPGALKTAIVFGGGVDDARTRGYVVGGGMANHNYLNPVAEIMNASGGVVSWGQTTGHVNFVVLGRQ